MELKRNCSQPSGKGTDDYSHRHGSHLCGNQEFSEIDPLTNSEIALTPQMYLK
jgi:hypothetical protein